VPSVARTWSVCVPGVVVHGTTHWTQVASEIGLDSRASCQTPSIETSTFEIPRSGAHATPAIGTVAPALTSPRGVSIRDCVRIGAYLAQPSGTQ
jgi:hypothetical protein